MHKVAVIEEQSLGCTVRNDPNVPVQQILRTLLRMKMSGEIDDIIQLYTGERAPNAPQRLIAATLANTITPPSTTGRAIRSPSSVAAISMATVESSTSPPTPG